MTKRVIVSLSDTDSEILEAHSDMLGMSQASLVRMLIRMYLAPTKTALVKGDMKLEDIKAMDSDIIQQSGIFEENAF